MKKNEATGRSSDPIGKGKSMVLDVKPLRSLAPIFPHNNEPGFNSSPAPEPSTPRFSQFDSSDNHINKLDIYSPAPLRSFPASQGMEVVLASDDSDYEPSKDKKRAKPRSSSSSKKRMVASTVEGDQLGIGITSSQRETGDRELVITCLMRYDALRRRLIQLEEAKENHNARHPHLKASTILMNKGLRTNMVKRIGPVPGVEIGDIFYFRMELCMVGVHMQTMGGIDYITLRNGEEDEPIATSIVSAGGYDDNAEDANMLIYTGQGGNSGSADQKLERGNLALQRSSCKANEIRVIRGIRDPANSSGKLYVYDGLYKIRHSWLDIGKSGGTIFKHEMVRVPGQEHGFAVWKQIQSWKSGFLSRQGLVSSDLSSGTENLKIPVYNIGEKELSPFTYRKTAEYPKSFESPYASHVCACGDSCRPGMISCSCVFKNSGLFPYTGSGLLVRRRDMVYECGETCSCGSTCKSRVVQGGLKLQLEVFMTSDRGWGVRSIEPIRAGTFVCEYAGQVVEEPSKGDWYVFDSSRAYQPLKWNCEAGLAEDNDDEWEGYAMPYRVVISGKTSGNVSRFVNHSCEPNLFWQPVSWDSGNGAVVRIALFAMRHVPPMAELTYDYGDSDGRIPCLCGTLNCRRFFC